MKNRRTHKRYDLQEHVEYVLNSASEVYKAVTFDVSSSGVGLFVLNPLCAGQEIVIKSGLKDSYRKGIVRWCRRLDGGIYKLGLMFEM